MEFSGIIHFYTHFKNIKVVFKKMAKIGGYVRYSYNGLKTKP